MMKTTTASQLVKKVNNNINYRLNSCVAVEITTARLARKGISSLIEIDMASSETN